MRRIIPVIAFLAMMAPMAVLAQTAGTPNATVVTTCGTQTYPAGTARPVTQSTTGNQCINGGGGISPGPFTVTPTDYSTTLTVAGTSQTAIAANATRKGCLIENPASATTQGIAVAESLFVNFGAAASVTAGSYEILPGGSIGCELAPNGTTVGTVTVNAVTIAHKFTAKEMN